MVFFFVAWLKASKYILLRYFLIAGIFYLLFYVVLRNKSLFVKLQTAFPARKSMLKEIMNSAVTIVIFSAMAAIVFGVFPSQSNMYFKLEDRGMIYYLLSFPLMFIIHDTYFYWIHRFMHLPILFKHIHLIHHRSTNPTPWTSYSFHIAEAILEAGILPLIAFTLPVHRSALILFFLLQFIYNVYGHLGYEIYPRGFQKTWIGKWINTSTAHNMHHKYFKGNYGLYFLFWDRLMGTLDTRYEVYFDERSVEGKTKQNGSSSVKTGTIEV
jgi:Delta7-sterol 5-desaturase